MAAPWVGFIALFLLLFFAIRSGNRSRARQYEILTDAIASETTTVIHQARSSTVTSGLKNRNYLFRKCDLYATPDALIVLGYDKNSFIKQLSLPIILTKAAAHYQARFPFALVHRPQEISFEDQLVRIRFGESGILKTEVYLKLKQLLPAQVAALEKIASENNWP